MAANGDGRGSLRDRCAKFYGRLSRNAILRQGNPVEDIMAFVMSEGGRPADKALEDVPALVLYFPTEEDRSEFVEMWRREHPGSITKDMP